MKMPWDNLIGFVGSLSYLTGRFAAIHPFVRLGKAATTMAVALEALGQVLREAERAEARARVLEWEGVWLWT